MHKIYKEVRRTWRERLLSLTPWKATKLERDWDAERDVAQRYAMDRIRENIRQTAKVPSSKASGFTPPRPMPPARRPSDVVYSGTPTPAPADYYAPGSSYGSAPEQNSNSFTSGGGGDFGGAGATGSWESPSPAPSSCPSSDYSSSSSSDSSSSCSSDSGSSSSYSSD